MRVNELETPVPVVDIDCMESNIARLQAYLDEHKIANRPHIKTHKIPAIARMQMDAGAVGITCQKLGEAEVMAAAAKRANTSTPTASGSRRSRASPPAGERDSRLAP